MPLSIARDALRSWFLVLSSRFRVPHSSILIPQSSFLVPRLRFPRASAGFMILAASMLPSALPAARVGDRLLRHRDFSEPTHPAGRVSYCVTVSRLQPSNSRLIRRELGSIPTSAPTSAHCGQPNSHVKWKGGLESCRRAPRVPERLRNRAFIARRSTS